MGRKELIELNIQERLSEYFKKNDGPGMARLKRSEEFLALLEEKAPNLVDEFQKYLDWIASHGGDEQEGIYLFGLHDGFWLMLDMLCDGQYEQQTS